MGALVGSALVGTATVGASSGGSGGTPTLVRASNLTVARKAVTLTVNRQLFYYIGTTTPGTPGTVGTALVGTATIAA